MTYQIWVNFSAWWVSRMKNCRGQPLGGRCGEKDTWVGEFL